jgi:hypothetical protein
MFYVHILPGNKDKMVSIIFHFLPFSRKLVKQQKSILGKKQIYYFVNSKQHQKVSFQMITVSK